MASYTVYGEKAECVKPAGCGGLQRKDSIKVALLSTGTKLWNPPVNRGVEKVSYMYI